MDQKEKILLKFNGEFHFYSQWSYQYFCHSCFNFEEDASETKRKKESRTELYDKDWLRESQAGELLFLISVGKNWTPCLRLGNNFASWFLGFASFDRK